MLSSLIIAFMCRNYQRDGPMTVTNNQGGAPNYFPNSFSGPQPNRSAVTCHTALSQLWKNCDRFYYLVKIVDS